MKRTGTLLIAACLAVAGSQASYGMLSGYLQEAVVGTSPGPESGRSQNPKLQEILKRLHSSEVYERQRAAIELGNLRDPGGVAPLIEALKDDDDFVRNFAARSLGELKDSRGVDPLIQAMADKNLLVRRSSVESLGFIGDAKAVAPLIEAARNGDDIVRRAAVEALGRIGDPGAIGVLVETLQDDDVYLQNGAAVALANIGEPAVAPLVGVLSDWYAGPWARKILEDLKWKPSTDEERTWFAVAARDIKSILENWDTARKVLFEGTESGDSKRIENSVLALIGIGRIETVDELVKVIERDGTETMAKAYMACGNDTLIEAAHNWMSRNSIEFNAESLQPVVLWGSMTSS